MNTDHTAAVIEAARKLMEHVRIEIEVDRKTKETLVSVMIQPAAGQLFGATFAESDEPLPDTLLGRLVELSGAIEAYDEAETESDILTTESEG